MCSMANLSRTILTVLLCGRHAALGGRSSRDRAANLARIAAAYSVAELEQEKGIGPARAAEVEAWLRGQGLSLRVEHVCPVSAAPLAAGLMAGMEEQVASSKSP